MAVPAYATNLNDIILEMASTTGWSLISSGGGGANSLTAPESDDFIQGANCISRNPWTSANIRGMVYNSAETITADEAVFIWWKSDVAQALDTFAVGGIQCLVGSGTGALECYYVDGSDTYARGGWKCSPVDPAITGDTQIGTPGGATDYFGVRWSIATSGPNKGFPYKIDAMRHGSNIEITAGEIANPASFATLTTYADDITRRWGIVQPSSTGMTQQGLVSWGTTATAVYSRVANRTLVFLDTLGFTVTTFTAVEFRNVGSDIEWDNVSIATLDTLNRGTIEVFDNAPTSLTNCNISDIDTTVDGGTNSVWDGTTWRRCNAITAAGGTFLGCDVLEPSVAANTSGFIYNIAADPDGELDGMSFTQDGTIAHHAIEFGASIAASITLRSMTFTDFDADDTDGSSLHFLDTTGTITVNLFDMATPTYRSAGATILFVNAKDVSIQVSNANDLTDIEDATVLLLAATGGNLPFEDVVTITSSGTTATVTHTAHAIPDGEKVEIKNAVEPAYNGVFVTTFISTSSYSYTMLASTTSPATGTILATGVILAGLTSALGVLARTDFPFSADQPVAGRVRKNPPAPYFSQALIPPGTLDTNGFSATALMIPD